MAENQSEIDNRPAPANLDVNQDLAFQRREWTVQRLGWLVMAAIIILALAGLTGVGPLARADASDPGNALWIEYTRFERVQAATDMQIEVAANGSDQVGLWLSNEFLEGVSLEFISPDPIETRAEAERQLYVFAAIEGADTVPVTISFRPTAAGPLTGRAGTPDGEEVTFGQFVFP